MNEELQSTLDQYGITLDEYLLGCSVSDDEFYSMYGGGK